jgi:hypothetical protein
VLLTLQVRKVVVELSGQGRERPTGYPTGQDFPQQMLNEGLGDRRDLDTEQLSRRLPVPVISASPSTASRAATPAANPSSSAAWVASASAGVGASPNT